MVNTRAFLQALCPRVRKGTRKGPKKTGPGGPAFRLQRRLYLLLPELPLEPLLEPLLLGELLLGELVLGELLLGELLLELPPLAAPLLLGELLLGELLLGELVLPLEPLLDPDLLK